MSAEVNITCNRCGQAASVTEYQALVKRSLRCRPCLNAQSKVRRDRLKAEGRPIRVKPEYAKAYYDSHKSNPETKARRAADQRRYSADPALRAKHEARWQTRRAISSGALVRQPCEVCGEAKVDAHHDDYTKPLDVRWLCKPHHREHHAKFGGEA